MTSVAASETSSGRRLQYGLESAAFFAVVGLLSALPMPAASAFAGGIARVLGPLTPFHARAAKRLERVMPDVSRTEVRRILARMWENVGRTFGELPHLGAFSMGPDGNVALDGREMIDWIKVQRRGAILISGHFANWELMPLVMKEIGIEGGEVYRAANNPRVNEYILGERRKHICALQIPKGSKGARQLIALASSKKLIAMLVDQKMNDGIEVPFFGMPAMTPSAAAQLARRYDMPIVPCSFERISGTRFRMCLHEAIEPRRDGAALDEREIMSRVNAFLEAQIRARPHEWLWLHKRWPE